MRRRCAVSDARRLTPLCATQARKTYCTTTEAIQEHGAELSATTGLAVKVTFQQRKGFALSIPAHEYDTAPAETRRCFVQATKKGRNYVCATGELNGLNTRLLDVAKDALLLSIMVADGVVASVRDALPALTAFAEAISLLDMVVNAFAATISGSVLPFVRPRLTLDGPLAIGNGRHPVACAHMRSEGREYVPNSTFISDAASFGAWHALRLTMHVQLTMRLARSRDHRREHGRKDDVSVPVMDIAPLLRVS